ncbi:selenide [Salpingoeca rosetta]|uniref:Selenide n=1 Tax=Salpingoeca rosetta (strain ATCC 50818 / BSB-021) TaxID=946362 RepID=F2U4M7_SALR5|nr:selenide [Salpingoeca rosetta]EGD82593.1 selenide [Salpingoeca rosetta]|eukprot:XP_004995829.1 selenide [Salpingoeca rosetta]
MTLTPSVPKWPWCTRRRHRLIPPTTALTRTSGSRTLPSSKDEVRCKVPQQELLQLLEELKPASAAETAEATSVIGIGLDSCVIKTRHKDIFLVQTTDFFYPLIDDPYIQGKIAAANVLSDLYAMGVTQCDNMLMLLALSMEMPADARKVTTSLVMKGFRDACHEADTSVNGGQTVLNPWMIVGGVASSVAAKGEFIEPAHARAGDVLVLTKPLGTQPAVNAHQWLHTNAFQRVQDVITPEEAVAAYRMAMHSMARLNRNAAKLMHECGARGATDVTGFGLLGHARNLAEAQDEQVDFIIDSLPVIAKMPAVNSKFNFKLLDGFSAETSGGLLVVLPPDQAERYCAALQEMDGIPAWTIGRVVKGNNTASLAPDVKVEEVHTPQLFN